MAGMLLEVAWLMAALASVESYPIWSGLYLNTSGSAFTPQASCLSVHNDIEQLVAGLRCACSAIL